LFILLAGCLGGREEGRERGREGGREGGRGESGRVLTQGLGYRVLDKRFRQFECMG